MLKKEIFFISKEGWKAPANQRSFFDGFARSNNFNPLDAQKWYSVTLREVIRAGGGGMLDYYNGSHIEALIKLYPELMLKRGNFFRSEKKWKERNFFNKFASSKNFNPLDTEKWYSVTNKDIIRAGGGKVLLNYEGSHIKALVKLYPELMLKKGNFLQSEKGWKATTNQREFFDGFARSNNFNPLDAENWYSVTLQEITRAGGSGLLKYYNGSHIKALVRLYPELMFKKGNFFRSEKMLKARNFFDEFARSKNFNPLEDKKWYSVTKKEVIRAGGEELLMNYKGSHIKALVKLYPELMLKQREFKGW